MDETPNRTEHICEEFCKELRLGISQYKASLRDVRDSTDYKLAIRTLARATFSAAANWKFWIDELGLSFCSWKLPSELFVNPIQPSFSIHHWQMEDLGDPGFETGFSDFSGDWQFRPIQLSQGIVSIHFASANVPEGETAPAGKDPVALIVEEDFLQLLLHSNLNSSSAASFDTLATNASAIQLHLSRNQRSLVRLFGPSGITSKTGLSYCGSICSLSRAIPYQTYGARHLYIVPAGRELDLKGVFYFLFQSELSELHKLVLRFVSERLFTSFVTLDRIELERRAVLLHGRLAEQQAELHTLRNALGAIRNRLQIISKREAKNSEQSIYAHVDDALRGQAEALACVDRLEGLDNFRLEPDVPITSIEALATLLRSQCGIAFDSHIAIAEKDRHTFFSLSGSVSDLARSLYQFLEVSLKANIEPLYQPLDIPPEGLDKSLPKVYIWLYEGRARLFVTINVGRPISEDIERAIRSVNILGRLPSQKPKGGRGILSSIQTIRTVFQGICTFSGGTTWFINVPVAFPAQDAQLRLFGKEPYGN